MRQMLYTEDVGFAEALCGMSTRRYPRACIIWLERDFACRFLLPGISERGGMLKGAVAQ